jgi:homopolymeric O-antigen transport system permease protein
MLDALVADFREMFAEQVEYRELLVRMTARDLLIRYKQTVMGFGWAIFTPLVNTVVFSVIFTRVAPLDVGVPYPVFAFCGLLAWNFFASSLRFSLGSLTGNVALVTKVFFPREILPFSALIVCGADFAVASLVLVGFMVYYHVAVGPAILFLPVVLAVQLLFAAGVCLLLAMANLFYRDVKYLFEVVIMVWMFATSVLYPTETVGGRLGMVLRLNPMTTIIDAFRSVIIRHQLPDMWSFGIVSALSVLFFAASWIIFHRAEFQFAENV